MKTFYWLIILLLFTASCTQSTIEKNPDETATVDRLELKYAKWFNVDYLKDYKKITVINPWTKEVYWEYHLYENDTNTLNTTKQSVLSIPQASIVLSGTQIGMFNKLSILNKIVSISNVNYIYNPTIRAQVKSGSINELGDESTLNVEKAFSSKADIIFTTAWDKIDPKFTKLMDQNLPIAFTLDWQEESPLARAEWIKFVAAFYNLEEEAIAIFDSIEHNYLKLVDLALNSSNRPSVLHGAPISGIWYIAGGKSFAAKFYKDAGADYLWKEDRSTGSLPLSFEAVFNKAEKADFWFNNSSYTAINNFLELDHRYGLLSSLQKQQIFTNGVEIHSEYPSSFWEEGSVNPDLVLKDIISILHPKLLPKHRLRFYRNIK